MITKPKGTYDLLGDNSRKFLQLEKLINLLMECYNYSYIRTPLFEATDLYHRGVGDTTDIVTKETYDFVDRGDRHMTLRPEGTAGVVRSVIENKLYTTLPQKLFYVGPMYRYERPQSGRFREHYQFGVEVFGVDNPSIDAEVISIPVNLFNALGLENVKVHINSIGDLESRKAYKEALLEYFRPHLDLLCEDCKKRYEKNPLRILDCKVDCDLDVIKNAPVVTDYLNEESKKYFDGIIEALDALGIEYIIDKKLVRGLDYYTHTVFEIEASSKELGKANIMCGGGRYNNLVSDLDGPNLSAVGFGMGLERVLSVLESNSLSLVEEAKIDAFIAPVSEKERLYALALCQDLRLNGFTIDMDYMGRSLKNNFKQAENKNANCIIIIGEDELNEGYLTVKNLKNKKEEKVEIEYIMNYLDELEFVSEELSCDCGCDEECTCDDDCDCEDCHCE